MRLIAIATFCVLLGLVYTGHKRFTVWQQVTDVYAEHFDLNSKWAQNAIIEQNIRAQRPWSKKLGTVDLAKENNTILNETRARLAQPVSPLDRTLHLIRGSLILPLIYLAKNHYDLHLLFSLEIIMLILLMGFILGKSTEMLGYKHATPFYLSFLGLVSVFMNGRMMFSLFSSALLIYLIFNTKKFPKNNIVSFLLSLFILLFASVSTGVFTVIYLAYLFGTKKSIPMFVTTIIGAPVFFAGLYKNILFFNADIFTGLLRHGAGEFMFSTKSLLALGLILLGYKLIPQNAPKFLILLTILGAIGGLFGYATLSVSLPPLIILIFLKIMPNVTPVSSNV